MAHNTSVVLSEHFATFVEEQVGTGRYGSASEVVRAGLRLLEEREAYLDSIRSALLEGERSGPAGPLDMKEIRRKAKEGVKASRAA